jgi:hypothetical protein
MDGQSNYGEKAMSFLLLGLDVGANDSVKKIGSHKLVVIDKAEEVNRMALWFLISHSFVYLDQIN